MSNKTYITQASTAREHFARYLSDLFNPLFLSTLIVSLALISFELSTLTLLGLLTLLIVLTSILPISILRFLKKLEYISSMDIHVRENRLRVFVLVMGTYLIFLGTVEWMGYEFHLLRSLVWIFIINMGLSLSITLFWKISIHNATLASTATLLFFFTVQSSAWHFPSWVEFLFYSSILLIPIMNWARHLLGVHTWAQCIVGTFSGIIVTWIEIELLLR